MFIATRRAPAVSSDLEAPFSAAGGVPSSGGGVGSGIDGGSGSGVGEGGSGGALAIGIGDRVLMLENAVYSVITPEGCAAILWKDAAEAARAAESLRLTATDLKKFQLIDEIIPESAEWRVKSDDDPKDEKTAFEKVSKNIKSALVSHLKELNAMSDERRLAERYEKFRKMGKFEISVAA